MNQLRHLALSFAMLLGCADPVPIATDAGTAETDSGDDAGGQVGERFDVVIAGAGSGGISAAIAAARLGASVLLIEETDWVGGQMGAAAVTSMDGGFDATGTGMYAEFRERIVAYYSDPARFPPSGKPVNTCYGGPSVCFEPHVGRQILEAWLAEEGVPVRFRTRVVSVLRDGDRVTGVVTDGGDTIASEVLIDATEHGDVIPLTGARYRLGNSTSDAPDLDSCIQDLTYLAVIRRYPSGVPAELRITAPPPGYTQQLRDEFATLLTRDGIPDGYPFGHAWHNQYRGMPDSTNPEPYTNATPDRITRTGVNYANDYPGYYTWWNADGSVGAMWRGMLRARYLEDREERRRVDCEAKLLTLQFLYYFQTEIDPEWSVANDEGYDTPYNLEENACPNIPEALRPLERHLPLMPYVRESRRIVAVHTLTADDIFRDAADPYARTRFASSLAVGDYGTDLHNCHEDVNLEGSLGEVETDGSRGGPFQVPFETFIPERIDGFVAAEKNIGVTRLVNGATRLQPITMLTGAAAGTIAALAATLDVLPRDVDPLAVQLALVDTGAAVAIHWYADVPPSHTHFGDVQIASVRGYMTGTSATTFGPDADTTRAQAAVVLASLFGLDVSSPPAVPTFDDVPADHFAFRFIEAMAEAGLTSGCAAGLFCPDAPVTRGQLAVFSSSGLSLAASARTFDDVSGPAAPSIAAAVEAGLIEPCGATTFCPDDPASRGVLARVVRRALAR